MSEELETTKQLVDDAVKVISPSADDLAAPRAPKAKKPALTKYEVINGAISPNGGSMEDLVHPGSIVELTVEVAQHYNKLGYLKPVIES